MVMTHRDRGHYAKKHPENRKINTAISEAVKEKAPEDRISCAAAFKIVKEQNTTPKEVGFTLDLLEKRIVKCQLGLFGYEPEKKVVKPMEQIPEDLEEAIKSELANNRISCRNAWDIAKTLGVKKMDVSAACERLGIKISPCQLGSF